MYSFVHSVWKQIQQLWRKLKCSSDFSKYYLPHGFCLHRFFFFYYYHFQKLFCFTTFCSFWIDNRYETRILRHCCYAERANFRKINFHFDYFESVVIFACLLRICYDLCLTTSNLLWSLLYYFEIVGIIAWLQNFEFVVIFAWLFRICSDLCLATSNLLWSLLDYSTLNVLWSLLDYRTSNL